MTLYSIDSVVREALNDKQFPIHYYMQFLSYALSCIRELQFDVMQNIKSTQLTPSSYNTLTIPCDYVDYVRIGELEGQYFTPWAEDDNFTREYKLDENGNKVPYDPTPKVDTSGLEGQVGFQNIFTNEWGEDLGRQYSFANGIPSHSFKVLRERNEIHLANAPAGKITVEYITDGLNPDATTCIHPYAVKAVKDWIHWQYKLQTRGYSESERQKAEDQYYNSERILRGRLDPIDFDNLVRELRSGKHAAVKQ